MKRKFELRRGLNNSGRKKPNGELSTASQKNLKDISIDEEVLKGNLAFIHRQVTAHYFDPVVFPPSEIYSGREQNKELQEQEINIAGNSAPVRQEEIVRSNKNILRIIDDLRVKVAEVLIKEQLFADNKFDKGEKFIAMHITTHLCVANFGYFASEECVAFAEALFYQLGYQRYKSNDCTHTHNLCILPVYIQDKMYCFNHHFILFSNDFTGAMQKAGIFNLFVDSTAKLIELTKLTDVWLYDPFLGEIIKIDTLLDGKSKLFKYLTAVFASKAKLPVERIKHLTVEFWLSIRALDEALVHAMDEVINKVSLAVKRSIICNIFRETNCKSINPNSRNINGQDANANEVNIIRANGELPAAKKNNGRKANVIDGKYGNGSAKEINASEDKEYNIMLAFDSNINKGYFPVLQLKYNWGRHSLSTAVPSAALMPALTPMSTSTQISTSTDIAASALIPVPKSMLVPALTAKPTVAPGSSAVIEPVDPFMPSLESIGSEVKSAGDKERRNNIRYF